MFSISNRELKVTEGSAVEVFVATSASISNRELKVFPAPVVAR